MTTWREHARQTISDLITAARDEWGLEGDALIAFIDDGYPYGERKMLPYKVWLEERNVALVALGLAEPNTRTRRLQSEAYRRQMGYTRDEQIAAGQLSLMDGAV